MKEIILNTVNKKSPNYKKYSALIDDEDFDNVYKHKWYVTKSCGSFYAQTSIGQKRIFLHNFVMGFVGVDHINHNGLDCQKHNLRKATKQQNSMNTRPHKDSSSKYKGVFWNTGKKKWEARIMYKGKTIRIGRFKDEKQAAQEYNETARKLGGEFAYLNVI